MWNNKVKFFLNQFDSENIDTLYVLGVSGGPDSMFMLDMMRKIKLKIVVCHVNYNKRSDSWIDELIVSNYCKKFTIDFFTSSPQYEVKKNDNFQSFARDFRYKYFSKISNLMMIKYGYKNVN